MTENKMTDAEAQFWARKEKYGPYASDKAIQFYEDMERGAQGLPDTEERERLAIEYMENAEPHTWINCKASWGTEEVTIKLHQYSSVQGEEVFCIERQGGALCLVPQSELIILD